MSNDREPLELAAKAAGLIVDPNTKLAKFWTVRDEHGRLFDWNPLIDDGDEARLEAVLGLNVLWGSRTVTVGRKHFGLFEEQYQEHGGDKQAARRRAGVRAAAEIGRNMK